MSSGWGKGGTVNTTSSNRRRGPVRPPKGSCIDTYITHRLPAIFTAFAVLFNFLTASHFRCCRTAPKKLNIVLILADDLGWTDLACFGSNSTKRPISTGWRATDEVHAELSACTVCSPTRAAMLTGKYPARLHITDWIPGRCRTTQS